MVTEALGLLQSVIAECKKNGFCKLEITARVAQDNMVFGDPDCLCGASPDGDVLASYILDKELLMRVIHACHCCTTARDVTDRVLFLLKQSPIWDRQIMTSAPFLESLIPHLVNIPQKPTARQIYMAVYRHK